MNTMLKTLVLLMGLMVLVLIGAAIIGFAIFGIVVAAFSSLIGIIGYFFRLLKR